MSISDFTIPILNVVAQTHQSKMQSPPSFHRGPVVDRKECTYGHALDLRILLGGSSSQLIHLFQVSTDHVPEVRLPRIPALLPNAGRRIFQRVQKSA